MRTARKTLCATAVAVLAAAAPAVAAPADLDTSFSGDGKAATSFGTFDFGADVAVQPNGRIVVAGTTLNASGDGDFALARYLTNGSLDTTFSGDGRVTSVAQTYGGPSRSPSSRTARSWPREAAPPRSSATTRAGRSTPPSTGTGRSPTTGPSRA